MTSISCIIPTLGRLPFLLATLRDLLKQEQAVWECVVVSQGESDFTQVFELARQARIPFRAFHCFEVNASLARNVGLVEATAPVVLFLDDDVRIPSRTFLSAHLRHYQDNLLAGVAGQILDTSGRTRGTRHFLSNHSRAGWLYFASNYERPCQIRNGGSGNLSVRREWAIAVGGMDAQFEKGAHREESDFCLRLTQRYGSLRFDPDASLVHLAASKGGCRNWGMNRGIHPLHHVTGEWYFILKNLREKRILWRDLPHHLLQLYLRQIWSADNKWRPGRILSAVQRSAEGCQVARQKLKEGPKYLSEHIAGRYKIIAESSSTRLHSPEESAHLA